MTIQTIDIAQLKESIDVRALAERSTELRRASGKELCGPCPKCGGDDRFHCAEEWFFCRQCHPERGDVIEYIQWLEGLDFREARARLTNAPLQSPTQPQHRRRPPATATQPQTEAWQAAAERKLEQAQEKLLYQAAGEPGREYLLSRGMEPYTWQRFRLGFGDAALPGTQGKQLHPAILIPWTTGVAGQVVGVRYRFLQTHTYVDKDGKPSVTKQTALSESKFSGHLFGGLGLLRYGEELRTLIICEGELNALSIWQAVHDTGVDVLSTGSEGQQLTPAMVKYAQRFKHVIVWADRAAVADALRTVLPDCDARQSPNGQDANDLLRAGKLIAFLTRLRAKLCRTDSELEGLMWAMWDKAYDNQGVDSRTAKEIQRIAQRLGKQVALHEPAPGRWIAAS